MIRVRRRLLSYIYLHNSQTGYNDCQGAHTLCAGKLIWKTVRTIGWTWRTALGKVGPAGISCGSLPGYTPSCTRYLVMVNVRVSSDDDSLLNPRL